MRLYSFVNYYLSPLQAGLQTAHVVGELMTSSVAAKADLLGWGAGSLTMAWARVHKTIIILNGGNCESLATIYENLVDLKASLSSLPVAKFNEDIQSLNGALTAVGVIVPEYIYNHGAADYFSPDMGAHELAQYNILPAEHQLAVLIRSCPLAR